MKEGKWYDLWRIHAFCNFISLLYMNSDCLLVLFTVTYVTTLLQLLTEDVISLVLSLVYEMNKKQAALRLIFSRTVITFSCHPECLVYIGIFN